MYLKITGETEVETLRSALKVIDFCEEKAIPYELANSPDPQREPAYVPFFKPYSPEMKAKEPNELQQRHGRVPVDLDSDPLWKPSVKDCCDNSNKMACKDVSHYGGIEL